MYCTGCGSHLASQAAQGARADTPQAPAVAGYADHATDGLPDKTPPAASPPPPVALEMVVQSGWRPGQVVSVADPTRPGTAVTVLLPANAVPGGRIRFNNDRSQLCIAATLPSGSNNLLHSGAVESISCTGWSVAVPPNSAAALQHARRGGARPSSANSEWAGFCCAGWALLALNAGPVGWALLGGAIGVHSSRRHRLTAAHVVYRLEVTRSAGGTEVIYKRWSDFAALRVKLRAEAALLRPGGLGRQSREQVQRVLSELPRKSSYVGKGDSVRLAGRCNEINRFLSGLASLPPPLQQFGAVPLTHFVQTHGRTTAWGYRLLGGVRDPQAAVQAWPVQDQLQLTVVHGTAA